MLLSENKNFVLVFKSSPNLDEALWSMAWPACSWDFALNGVFKYYNPFPVMFFMFILFSYNKRTACAVKQLHKNCLFGFWFKFAFWFKSNKERIWLKCSYHQTHQSVHPISRSCRSSTEMKAFIILPLIFPFLHFLKAWYVHFNLYLAMVTKPLGEKNHFIQEVIIEFTSIPSIRKAKMLSWATVTECSRLGPRS